MPDTPDIAVIEKEIHAFLDAGYKPNQVNMILRGALQAVREERASNPDDTTPVRPDEMEELAKRMNK